MKLNIIITFEEYYRIYDLMNKCLIINLIQINLMIIILQHNTIINQFNVYN